MAEPFSYRDLIEIEPGRRGGCPCVRGTRVAVAVADVLGWLAAGMSEAEITADFPEVESEHVGACLAYAADRERRVVTVAA